MSAADMISPFVFDEAVKRWISSDIPAFDIGGAVVGKNHREANFLVKSNLVLAGQPFVTRVMNLLDCKVDWIVEEGKHLAGSGKNRVCVGRASGPAHRLLQAERTALEILTRCSACATVAAALVKESKGAGWTGHVAATRKTTPGAFRMIEKYGAIIGGADPHRYSLSSMVMLKDNHIDVAGSITTAVKQTRALCGFSTKIEVECRSEADAIEAAKAGADVVMLDNFTPAQSKDVAPRLKRLGKDLGSGLIVEVSGGITVQTIQSYANPGVDIISIGAITHGPPPVDISMKIVSQISRSKL